MTQIKEWLSLDDQIQKLKARNMLITDDEIAKNYLSRIGYYRLSGYWYPFRKFQADKVGRQNSFEEGTEFKNIIDLYIFDKKLRLLALDAIERIEMAIRTDIAYVLGKRNPRAHELPDCLHGNFTRRPAYKKNTRSYGTKSEHHKWLDKYDSLVRRSMRQEFIKHNLKKYGFLPVWVATEILDFGSMSRLYSGLEYDDAKEISSKYECASNKEFQTWLRSINHIRNIVAHHSRLWNANIVDRATIPKSDKYWSKLANNNEKPFVYFCLMQYLLKTICPNSTWGLRLDELLQSFPEVSKDMISIEDLGYIEHSGWDLWH